MIPIKKISRIRLENIWNSEAFLMDPSAYSMLFKTGKGKLTKRYRYENPDDLHMIQEDIKTLLAVSRQSEMFGKEFILPKYILQADSLIVGYEMPLIDGIRLSDAIRSCDSRTAIRWFVQIFNGIRFLSSLDEAMAFGDLHEDNILINKNGELYYCDIDGFRVLNGGGKYGRYFTMMLYLYHEFPKKYRVDKKSGAYLTDKNSDIACLVVMIMNYIMSGSDCYAGIPVNIAREYVAFIEQKGMPAGVIEMVRRLYRKEDNFVDLEALQKMPADLSPFSFETFKASNSKFQSEEDAIAFIENGFRRFDIERFL